MYGDNRLGVVTISHESGAHPHKREIGDGSGHQELEECLRPPDVASLAHAELHQPRQPMFGGLLRPDAHASSLNPGPPPHERTP